MMEYSEETSAGQGPDVNVELNEMGEIGLSSQVSAPFNQCADDGSEKHVEKWAENQNIGKCLADDNANDLVDESTGISTNSDYAPAYSAKKAITEFTETNYELQQAYRILRDLMSEGHKGVNSPFMDSVETIEEDMDDYYEVITKPMWLKKVRHKFLKREYNTITEVVADLRLILENCYRYYGPDSPFTKKALRLEQMLEQKLALLPRELRDKTTLEITSGRPVNDDIIATRRRSTRQSLDYTSILLNLVRHEKAERNRELKKKLTEGKKAEKEEKEKEVLVWEDTLLEEPLKTEMKAMWELPMIGHFFYLCQTVLNMPEVSQFELERILVMPRASSLLPKIMTSLLSNPTQRSSLDRNPPMPYKVWQSRLQNRIQSWYKIFNAREKRGDLVFQQLGIEANFFKILGTENPLNEKRFHELSFHQKIWCVKGLCDYILYNHRTVQDSLNDQLMDDMREYVLGCDSVGNMYLHFPQFCGQDLRIYKQKKCNKPPSPNCWGAPYTKKRKLPKKEKTPPQAPKKQKTSAPKPPDKKLELSEPPLALSCTRRSPRFSKIQDLPEKAPFDELEDADASEELTSEEEEQNSEESDSEEEEEDDDVKPDITKFELVVDSMESLRTFMDKFKNAYENMHNKKEKQPFSRCDAELYRRLKNLLEELEPWESKLQKSAQRIRNRLRREWEDFVEDEEIIEDIWGSDGESEDRKSSNSSSTSENSNEDASNSGQKAICKPERPTTRAKSAQKIQPVKQEEISTEELLNQDDDSCEYLTRGRLQQIRIMRSLPKKNIKPGSEIKVNGSNPGQQNLLLAHSRQNTASQAKELYAWETLRQILVPASNPMSTDPLASGDTDDQGEVSSLHNDGLRNKTNLSHVLTSATSPEKQNLIHAKLDMLGAMQAAMAKKPNASSLMPSQPQVNNCKNVLKTGQTKKNNHLLPGKQTKNSGRSTMLAPKMLSLMTTASTRPVSKYNSASSSTIPTKQQLSDLSSVAENTKNLKRLLERVNKVAPTTVISSTASSPAGSVHSTQQKAQVMLFPMFDADGKSVVYRVTSNKTLSSIPGMDIKKIALALATSTTSALPPGFLVEKIAVEGDLLHGETSNISQDVLADIAFRQGKPAVKTPLAGRLAISVPKSPQIKPTARAAKDQTKPLLQNPVISKLNAINDIPRLQVLTNQMPTNSVGSASMRCVSTSTSNSLLLNSPPRQIIQAAPQSICSKTEPDQLPVVTEAMVLQQPVQQQVLLVPVQNQHGQTMYLQIPAQSSGAINMGKSTLNQIQKLPISQQSQIALSAPSNVASRTILPTLAKACNSRISPQAGILGGSPAASGTPVMPNKAAPLVTQRLIPALSSKRQNSFTNSVLVSNPPPLAPLSKPNNPNSKLIGLQQGGSLVKSGLSTINLNAVSTANSVTSPLKNVTVSHNELGSLANNKPTTIVGSVMPIARTNGPTTLKNPVTPNKVNEQLAKRQIQSTATLHTISSPQNITTAPSMLTRMGSPMGVGVTTLTNQNVNPGIMPTPLGQSVNNNNNVNALPHLEYSPDALSASVASLVAKNPALAVTVQKYMQSGHRVVIAQQGNQLVLQAYPPQVNVTVPDMTASPAIAPQVTMAQKSTASKNMPSQMTLPQTPVPAVSRSSNVVLPNLAHAKNPAGVPPVQNVSMPSSTVVRIQNNIVSKFSSPNVTQTIVRPPIVIQNPAPSSLSVQVGVPVGAVNQATVPSMLQNVVCQTVGSSPNVAGVLANSAVITSTSGSPGQVSKTNTTTTPINTMQHKLVMIRDTTSDKQTLGILLDNGQVVPLNANISFTNAAVS